MKIRSDFVTNSSSSSYVIAYKGLDTPHPSIKSLNKMIEIVLFSDGGYETTRGEKVRTIDELDSYMVDTYGYSDLNTIDKLLSADSYTKKIHTECVKALNEGYTILFKDVGYSDETLSALLHDIANEDIGVKILFSDL
jgi:hypothetical protein